MTSNSASTASSQNTRLGSLDLFDQPAVLSVQEAADLEFNVFRQVDQRLVGTPGADRLEGGKGNDQISGKGGNDRLIGKAGDDKLLGNGGRDRLQGGDGRDRLEGDAGNDRLQGGKKDDRLFGGNGKDELLGGNGEDVIQGGSGADRISGGDGDDVIVGGYGDDRLVGGNGDDRFVYDSLSEDRDRIIDFDDDDQIDLSGILNDDKYNNSDRFRDYVVVVNEEEDVLIRVDPDGENGDEIFKTLVRLVDTSYNSVEKSNFILS